MIPAPPGPQPAGTLRWKQAVVTLREITVIQAPIERCFALALSIDVHLLDNPATAVAGKLTGIPTLGDSTTYRAKHFGTWQQLTTQITALHPPTYFEDRMTEGIFAFLHHQHRFRVLSSGHTEMTDHLDFAAPCPLLGLLAEQLVLKRYMRSLLRERIQVIKRLAESHLPAP